jgi:hypothetical protein
VLHATGPGAGKTAAAVRALTGVRVSLPGHRVRCAYPDPR